MCLSIQVINDNLSFDKITKFESIYEQPTQFPALSFCSDLPYEFENSRKFKIALLINVHIAM